MLYANVPSVVVATDHRILELCNAMRVPHVLTLERWLLPVANNVQEVGALPSFNIRDFVAHVASTFDGAAFDRNRAAVAAAYVRILQSLGVEPSPTLIRLASVPHRLY
jgi:hypothetical protein